MSASTTQKTFMKLYNENTSEAITAMENLLFSKPAKISLIVKEVSLEKLIQKKISVAFLQKLIDHKANVNEVISLKGYPPFKLLKRALSLKLYEHAALLISRGASYGIESKPSKPLPPIIVAANLVIKHEGMTNIIYNIIFYFIIFVV